MLLALFFTPGAFAAPEMCRPEVRVVGDQSRVRPLIAGYEVTGLWVLACEGGARFLAGATAELDHPPIIGELVGDGLNAAEIGCFGDQCALPPGTCVSSLARGAFALVDCEAFGPITDAVIGGRRPHATPVDDGGAWTRVVVDGHTVFATRSEGDTAVPADALDGYADATDTPPQIPNEWSPPEPEAAVASVETHWDPRDTEEPIIPPDFGEAPMRPAVAPSVVPEPEAVVQAVEAPADPAGLTLPATPDGACRALSDVVAREARKRVDAGDDRRMANDPDGAFREYRAAVTMDPCSANGWVGLGQSAIGLSRPDLAIRALRAGTDLAPRHYGAWALLGQAYEAILQRGLAHEAYSHALEASPYYPDAVEGEARTR